MDLLGPEDQLRGHPRDEREYRALLAALASGRRKSVVVDARTLDAYVNLGRWLADCPNCGAGIAVHPEWTFAGCLSCFRSFASIGVPARWIAIERELVKRPVRHQHWLCASQRTKWVGQGRVPMVDETVEDLEDQTRDEKDSRLVSDDQRGIR